MPGYNRLNNCCLPGIYELFVSIKFGNDTLQLPLKPGLYNIHIPFNILNCGSGCFRQIQVRIVRKLKTGIGFSKGLTIIKLRHKLIKFQQLPSSPRKKIRVIFFTSDPDPVFFLESEQNLDPDSVFLDDHYRKIFTLIRSPVFIYL